MNRKRTLDEQIEVTRPLAEAFAYISEFSNIREWDPAVRDAEKLTSGPPRVGSEFRVDMSAGFSLHYTIREIEPDRRMLMDVSGTFFSAEEEIQFSAAPSGTTAIRYIARFTFGAALGALDRLLPQTMDRVGKKAMAGMKVALEDNFAVPELPPRQRIADKLVLPGVLAFSRLGYTSSRKRFRPISADLSDRHVVITGATSGLGLAAARALAQRHARLTLVARDPEKGEKVRSELAREFAAAEVELEISDLSLMREVTDLSQRMSARGRPIDVLINNAGALYDERKLTDEGYERSFALLLLSPYVLTEQLHPLLCAAQGARVVNVSSGGMYSQRIRPRDLQYERGKFSGASAYARAKRGLVILTEHWAQQWEKDGIAVNAMHPGWADTPGVADSLPDFYRLTHKILRSPEEGADTIVWLAAASEAGRVSGKFWLDREPHATHLLAATRETDDERSQLLQQLEAMMGAALES